MNNYRIEIHNEDIEAYKARNIFGRVEDYSESLP
jgi:hypothetical protein